MPATSRSPDGTLVLRFERGPTSTYRLIEASSGRVLATAASAIRPDDFTGEAFRGTVNVRFAPDGSGVSIQEDISDASPAERYILIRRDDSSQTYPTRYLIPETSVWTTDPRYEFPYELPEVVSLTHDTITFRYLNSRQTRKVLTASVHSAESPTTAH